MLSGRIFKVAIAHDHFQSAARAQDMAERLAAKFEFVCDTWPFELLACERARESAAIVASEADVIIVAADNRQELSDHVKDWIETWIPRRSSASAVLVALLYEDGQPSAKPSRCCSYLQEAAWRAKMDFFCNVGRWWHKEAALAEFHSEAASQFAESASAYGGPDAEFPTRKSNGTPNPRPEPLTANEHAKDTGTIFSAQPR